MGWRCRRRRRQPHRRRCRSTTWTSSFSSCTLSSSRSRRRTSEWSTPSKTLPEKSITRRFQPKQQMTAKSIVNHFVLIEEKHTSAEKNFRRPSLIVEDVLIYIIETADNEGHLYWKLKWIIVLDNKQFGQKRRLCCKVIPTILAPSLTENLPNRGTNKYSKQ